MIKASFFATLTTLICSGLIILMLNQCLVEDFEMQVDGIVVKKIVERAIGQDIYTIVAKDTKTGQYFEIQKDKYWHIVTEGDKILVFYVGNHMSLYKDEHGVDIDKSDLSIKRIEIVEVADD